MSTTQFAPGALESPSDRAPRGRADQSLHHDLLLALVLTLASRVFYAAAAAAMLCG